LAALADHGGTIDLVDLEHRRVRRLGPMVGLLFPVNATGSKTGMTSGSTAMAAGSESFA
jgi:hypothetical protein